MLIFSTKGKITIDNDKSNLVHRFDMPENVKSINIKYSYSPKTVESREIAVGIIRDCFEKYDEQIVGKPADYLPVNNLITISLDDNGVYRGAAHRQANEQEHTISETFASAGFIKGKINSGEWDIMLNVHYIGCNVDYTITIEGEVE